MSSTTTESFSLKMSMLSLSEIELHTNNLNKILLTLEKKADIAAEFLVNSPVVINLKNLPEDEQHVDFAELNQLLRQYQMLPIGFKNANQQQAEQATQAGLSHLQDTLKSHKKPATTEQQPKNPKSIACAPAKIIKGTVRSGQQIIAQGDLIIVGSVSATAEVLAVGNIHIYGSLRGRALAGIAGNANTLIYCQKMQAELVSIAGVYQLSDDIPNDLDKNPILVQSINSKIELIPIN